MSENTDNKNSVESNEGKRKYDDISSADDASTATGAAGGGVDDGAAGGTPATSYTPVGETAIQRVIHRNAARVIRRIAQEIGLTDEREIQDCIDAMAEMIIAVSNGVCDISKGIANFLASTPGQTLLAYALAGGFSYYSLRQLTTTQFTSIIAMSAVSGLATSVGNSMISNAFTSTAAVGYTAGSTLFATMWDRFTRHRPV